MYIMRARRLSDTNQSLSDVHCRRDRMTRSSLRGSICMHARHRQHVWRRVRGRLRLIVCVSRLTSSLRGRQRIEVRMARALSDAAPEHNQSSKAAQAKTKQKADRAPRGYHSEQRQRIEVRLPRALSNTAPERNRSSTAAQAKSRRAAACQSVSQALRDAAPEHN